MRVLVISDSHGEIDNIIQISKVVREENISKVIHLGDDYDDVNFLIKEGIEIERIPGVFSGYYSEKDIPNRKILEIEGWRVLLTHTKERHENDLSGDISPEDSVKNGAIDIVLYGHTHIPAIAKEGTVYLLNPGHLKATDKKGYQPSFAVLDIEKDNIDITIKRLNTKETVLRDVIKRHKETD